MQESTFRDQADVTDPASSGKSKSKSKGSKKGGSRLIEATDKQPKAAHIRRRVKMAVGKTVEAALKMQVPDKHGAMVTYKSKDFKYDVKAGFLRF